MLLAPVTQLVEGLVTDYHQARSLVRPHAKITRGVARVTSSLAEERFAEFLVGVFPGVGHVYVDQELRFRDAAAAKVTKPDLVVTVDDEIRLLVDVKMDLGRLRDKLPTLASHAAELVSRWAGSECTTKVRADPGVTGKRVRTLALSSRCHYVLLLVSGQNIHAKQLKAVLASVSEHDRVSAVVLWPDAHPNDPRFADVHTAVQHLVNRLSTAEMDKFLAIAGRSFAG